MERPLRHFSLHRVGETELRVVSYVDEGALRVVQVEEEVIRAYAAGTQEPPRCVSLFILHDLQPLIRSVPSGARSLSGDPATLTDRPVINVYDPTDPATCHVFVNREAMQRAGYWDDPLAIRGLLAHEHAHPMAESSAVRASRHVRVELSWETREPLTRAGPSAGGRSRTAAGEPTTSHADRGTEFAAACGPWRERIDRLLAQLVDKLCVCAPREIFANEIAIRGGFDAALLHLNERNAANAIRGVEGRQTWLARLEKAERSGELSGSGADLLVLIGDMSGHLDMALEIAAFLRAGRKTAARELEGGLRARVFPALEPETLTAYEALRDRYVALSPDASADELVEWSVGLVGILATALGRKGLELNCRVTATT